jgi:uncharacterized protein
MTEHLSGLSRATEAKLRVIILHGAYGGPDTNWFPWLDRELQAEEMEVARPRLPTPGGQSLDGWFDAFDRAVPDQAPPTTMLVGHSLGAAFALRLVERSAEPFRATLLAAGFVGALGLPDYDPINATFFARPFDWPAIRDRAGHIFCWAGADDPYVPVARSRQVADLLGAPLHIVEGGGHLNAESDLLSFPALRDAILLNTQRRS